MILVKAVAICGIGGALMAGNLGAQSEADQLRTVELERLRSIVEADMEVARRLHADDFQLITPTGGAVSKEQYLALIQAADVDYREWETEEIAVRLHDRVAVIRYQARLRIAVRGEPDAPSGRFWHTDLYEKRNGQWQAVWSQATQIQ